MATSLLPPCVCRIVLAIVVPLALALVPLAGSAAPAKPNVEVIATDIAGFKKAFAEVRARPGTRAVLVNVWATWCEPCRDEMPDLVKFAKDRKMSKHRGVRVMLVSADDSKERDAVKSYLTSLGVDFPTYLKTGDDMEFINSIDPAWDGTIPASWLFDAAGKPTQAWHGTVSYAELVQKIEELAAPPPDPHHPRRKP